MQIEFDLLNQAKTPIVKLCKPSRTVIGILKVRNFNVDLVLGDTSEITFDIYKNDNGYENVLKYMVLHIEPYGYFEISNVKEDTQGSVAFKSVTAYGYEVTLKNYNLTADKEKVWELYSPVGEAHDNCLLKWISDWTGWKIAHVDGSLLNRRRTMDIKDNTAYELMMNDIAEAFKCYFVFDTVEKSFSCLDRESAPILAKINLGFRNFMQKIETNNTSDDIVTALTVKGSDGVGISMVNPLGNDVIYDFSYFYSLKRGMTQNLIDKCKAWQNKIRDYEETFAETKNELQDKIIELEAKQSELVVKQGELNSQKDLQSVAISTNENSKLPEYKENIERIESEISGINGEIDTLNNQITTLRSEISNIASELSFKNNFTEEEYAELEYYIKSGLYENDNFIFTDSMSESDKINIEQELYNLGKTTMKSVCRPQYEFTCTLSNFFMNKKYEKYAEEIELGKTCNVEIAKNTWIQPRIVKIHLDYEDILNSTIVFSDKFFIEGGKYRFIDIFTQQQRITGKVSKLSAGWEEPINSGFYSKVDYYINHALDLTRQEIINASGQEFAMGSYGLRGKKMLDDGTYSPCQIAMTNNVLAFTDDGWASCKAAIGKVKFGEDDNEMYGVVADAIVGRLLVSENLYISNSTNDSSATFTVNADGAMLKNADFTVEKNNTKIVVSPDDGFKIQKLKMSDEKAESLKKDIEEYEQLIADMGITKTINQLAEEYNSKVNGNLDYRKRDFFIPGNKMVEAGWTDFDPDYNATTNYICYSYEDSQNNERYFISITPIVNRNRILSPSELDSYAEKFRALCSSDATYSELLAADDMKIIGHICSSSAEVDEIEESLVDVKEQHMILMEYNALKREMSNDKSIWEDVLSEDTNGNIIAKSIKLQSGDIGGWTIESDRLTAPSGDYIASNGTGQLGLFTWGKGESGNWANFNGNIYANNLRWNNGDGSSVYVFNSGGWMDGLWIGDGTLSPGKRKVSEWDEIYAKKAAFDELYAAAARIDDLQAGFIVSEEGVVSPLYFGGRYKAYDLEHSERGSATMYGQLDDNAIRDNQKQISMFIEASGKIYLDSPFEVIAGHLNTDNTVEYRRITAGSFDAKTLVQTKQLDVYPDNAANGVSVNGTIQTQWLQVTNKINKCVVSDEFSVDEKVGAVFNGTVSVEKDTTTNGRLWINGGTAVTINGQYSHGATEDVNVGTTTLHFKSGIYVGHW